MITNKLVKKSFHNSVANTVYKEIVNQISNYYFFIGKTTPWADEGVPEIPIDNIFYENSVRADTVFYKKIKVTDVAFIINRFNWESGSVYDQYDDQYDTQLKGINLISGGNNYTLAPTVYIGTEGNVLWTPNTFFSYGAMVQYNNQYYLVTNPNGITTNTIPPTHTAGTFPNENGLTYTVADSKNGSGAIVEPIIDADSKLVIALNLTNAGSGYTSAPTINIVGGFVNDDNTENCIAEAVVAKGDRSNAQNIEECMYYVVTNDFKIFKCLDNNKGALSTVKPTSISHEPVVYSDGYIWKFVGIIHPSLQSKFLLDNYIPITTGNNIRYYANGQLNNINILNRGQNYTFASITIQGDGYSEKNPIYINSIDVELPGVNYSDTTTIIVEPPIDQSLTWVASTEFKYGDIIEYRNKIYEVLTSGVTATDPPTHTFDTANNGTTLLKYVGSTVKAIPIIDAGEVVSVVANGSIKEIAVTNPGSGYNHTPTITIIPDNVLWEAETVVTNGDVLFYDNRVYVVKNDGTTHTNPPTHIAGIVEEGTVSLEFLDYQYNCTTEVYKQKDGIIAIKVNDSGNGFTTIPQILIGDLWTPETLLIEGQQVIYNGNLYTAVSAAETGVVAPIHVTGTVDNLLYSGTAATADVSLKYGAGYSIKPNASVVDITSETDNGGTLIVNTSQSSAILYPVFYNGQLSEIKYVDPGIGYTYARLTVNGNGTGASLSANLNVSNLHSVQENIELLTVPGQINCIPLISGGYGYGVDTAIVINGNGLGATAVPVIEGGRIIKINMVTYGYNYDWATITITGNGSGAAARAIISPSGGHGTNILSEFNATKLMFYMNLSDDKIGGFPLANYYRQLGIIKNLMEYDSSKFITTNTATDCWSVITDINMTENLKLYDVDDNEFNVVLVNNNNALIQSINNVELTPGLILNTREENVVEDTYYTILSVTAPNVDKYSGELLYLDNIIPFATNAEQMITIRTILNF